MLDFPLNIIVPIYNSEQFIATFIENIDDTLQKLYLKNNLKVWLCNDASTDKTKEIILSQINKLKTDFVMIENLTNIGQYQNTKQAILQLPTPCYCLTIDADFQPDPAILIDFIPFCLKHKKLFVAGDFNPHFWGVRAFISFLYRVLLTIQTRKNLLFNYGSSLRWFYLTDSLKEKLKNGRIEKVLLQFFTSYKLYPIKKVFLKNYSSQSLLQIFRAFVK
ncbi:MAG: glycosyltransferase [Chitinophagales bacterium]|nr:glycosyltransferase [Chitinophagales bacterium]